MWASIAHVSPLSSRDSSAPARIPESSEVAVIGGGLIGCAVARQLALEGRQVALFERDAPGHAASGAGSSSVRL